MTKNDPEELFAPEELSESATAHQTSHSIWAVKPWWCQPWSIVLTGVSLISGSWLLFHRYWFTGLVSLPVVTWMTFFLLVYPRLFFEMEQREDVSAEI